MKKINCPVRKALDIIGGKWTLYLIHQVGNDTIRYGELKRKVDGISEKMFVNELKMLVENGILSKKSYGEIPPRVEYSLTDFGKELLPLIENLAQIGMKNLALKNEL
ncbi:helix-turn-helix domain-containing protein [Capnocytophaga sp.]|uniref:winged helix-turn-helix transcriptional regulator n=1 Tax=Capnocytophaga sp. TaxID=44737 RepID=UPI0026DCB2F4|nr:helix-turn-helix domain-containing protein [Capnocytophaga sp.]MDO5105222.1 helix-turn-helix domain-containing protein [Capnocytophaga sp.]